MVKVQVLTGSTQVGELQRLRVEIVRLDEPQLELPLPFTWGRSSS